jgi:hypothetical protein
MFKTLFAAALLGLAFSAPAGAEVRLGILDCAIDGGTGFVVTSNKALTCTFRFSNGGPEERYSGVISKLGVDLGTTHQGALQWAVLALDRNYDEGQLAGRYFGVNAEASIVTGGGANLLVGGFNKSFTLQPLSVQSQTGLNLALAVASMELTHSLK